MPKSKVADQFYLLAAALVFIVALLWLITFLEHRGFPDRMGFFIVFNIMGGFAVTWQGVVFFRSTPGFWTFHCYWAIAHVLVYGVWGCWGNRIELCAFTLPFETYWYYRVARYRSQCVS